MVNPGQKILQADMAALANLANSKATLPQYKVPSNPAMGNQSYDFPEWSAPARDFANNPKWLTELNRLRQNLANTIGSGNFAASGPWPVSSFTNVFSANANSLIFYYADNGVSQNVSLATGFIGAFGEQYIADVLAGTYNQGITTYSSLTFKIIVGGDKTVIMNGVLQTLVFDATLSGSPPPIMVTSSMLGLNFVLQSYGSFEASYISTFSNVSVPPGEYDITITIGNGGVFQNVTLTPQGSLTATYTEYNSQPANGIHNTLPVRKIICPQIPSGGKLPFGLWGKNITGLGSPHGSGQFYFVATGSGQNVFYQATNPNLVASTNGFFTALTPMLASPNVVSASQMPWNLSRHKNVSPYSSQNNPMLLGDKAPTNAVSNSYDNTTTVEAQLEPPSWIASRYFSVGFQIMDSNGNIQRVTVAGTSGSAHPFWSATVGATTGDGSVGWKCQVVLPAANSIAPALHRLNNIPRYPVYWQSETIASLKPPTSTSGLTIWGANNQWQRNNYSNTHDAGWQQDDLAFGWWIYSVSVNRIGANLKGGVLLPTQDSNGNLSPVAVTIGCIRNGAFVAFATFNTGTTNQVLWPVFTSDALVYQCAERVDIQAVALSGPVSVGTNASGYPVVAAFVSDVTALLNLIA